MVVHDPKVSKAGIQTEVLKLATPELFVVDFPIESRRIFTWKDSKVVHYNDNKALMEAIGVSVLGSLGEIPFKSLLEMQTTFMWEHSGVCHCGELHAHW